MNDIDLCLEVVSRSRQPLRYIWRWISRKYLVQKDYQITNRKWHMGYRMVTWPMTLRDPQRCCEAVRSAILATAWLLVYPRLSARIRELFNNIAQVRMFNVTYVKARRGELIMQFVWSMQRESTGPEWLIYEIDVLELRRGGVRVLNNAVIGMC